MRFLFPEIRRTAFGIRRGIAAGAALLLLLTQAAAAADRCLVERLAGHDESRVAVATNHHGSAPDAHCAVDLVDHAQAPATEPRRDTPDPDPGIALAVRWSAPPRVSAWTAQRDAPHTGPPRTLQFHSLRL